MDHHHGGIFHHGSGMEDMVKSLKGEVVTLETDENYYIMVDLMLDPRCLMNIMDFYHIRFAGKKPIPKSPVEE